MQKAQYQCLVEHVLSYKAQFFNGVTTISKFICTNWLRHSSFCGVTAVHGHLLCYCHHCWNALSTASLCSYPLFGLHQRSANVDECLFLHMEEFSDTPLLHMCLCVRCHSVRLPLCYHLSHSNKLMKYWWEDSTSTAVPPTSASDIMSQSNNMGGITFGAALIAWLQQKSFCSLLFTFTEGMALLAL